MLSNVAQHISLWRHRLPACEFGPAGWKPTAFNILIQVFGQQIGLSGGRRSCGVGRDQARHEPRSPGRGRRSCGVGRDQARQEPRSPGSRDRSKQTRRLGFSLVELMVVMIILGLLATATTVATRTYLDNARMSKVTIDIATFEKGIASFYAATGRNPTNDEGLEILTTPTKNSPTGYLNKISKDPWKRPYLYINPGSNGRPYEIICLGADGKEGGQKTDRDISSADLEND